MTGQVQAAIVVVVARLLVAGVWGAATDGARAADALPAALRKASASHSSARLLTARIEYFEHYRAANPNPARPPRMRFYTFRGAPDEHITVFQGDEDGLFMRDPDGEPAPYWWNGPEAVLAWRGETWVHRKDAPIADVWAPGDPTAPRNRDLRSALVHPGPEELTLEQWAASLREPDGRPPVFTEAIEGGLHIVTYEGDGGKRRFKWSIDPQRAWCVTRLEAFYDGEKTAETRFELQRFDGEWFPVRIEHYRHFAGDTDKPTRTIQVLSAEFHRPEHPLTLAPADIGIESGTNVQYQGVAEGGSFVWDGKRLESASGFAERLGRGEAAFGPTVARELARTPRADGTSGDRARLRALEYSAVEAARRLEGRWAAFTRAFILRHGLDGPQAQRAWLALKDCQEQAGHRLNRRKDDILAHEEALRMFDPTAPDAEAKLAALEKRSRALVAPLEDIFERQLKPRLRSLPTSAQRRDAEAMTVPQTQPVGASP